jgi:formylglycine-generating enzyme required for sulfatase activity
MTPSAGRASRETASTGLRGMQYIRAGTFAMGSDDFYPEERPVHSASVDGFWIDEYPVTAAERTACNPDLKGVGGPRPDQTSRRILNFSPYPEPRPHGFSEYAPALARDPERGDPP